MKNLSDIQFEFVKDLVELLKFCIANGYKVTLGEAWRPVEMQKIYYEKGLSRIREQSYHNKRLAIDLNIFVNGEYTTDKAKLQPIGDYWEALNPLNKWGGNWKTFVDTPHFERHISE